MPTDHIRIHYHRSDRQFNGWTVYSWHDTVEPEDWASGPVAVAGVDSFGAYFDVRVKADARNVGIVLHKGNEKDPGVDQFVNPALAGDEYWALSGVAQLYTSQPDVARQPQQLMPGYARLHYYRPAGDYSDWAVYTWGSSAEPANYADGPKFATGQDAYGVYFDVRLVAAPTDLQFILHQVATDERDPGPDLRLADVGRHREAWIVSGDETIYTAKPTPAQILDADFARLQAYWLDRRTIAVAPQHCRVDWEYALVYSSTAQLSVSEGGELSNGTRLGLVRSAEGLDDAQRERFPRLSGYGVFELSGASDSVLREALRAQLVLAASDADHVTRYLTGVQTAGVLDDLFFYDGSLGTTFTSSGISIAVWAPTAQSVRLQLFAQDADEAPHSTLPMQETNGVWSAHIDASHQGRYYLFDVTVYVHALRAVVHNIVTDPYSKDLGLNGTKSRLSDLAASATKPDGWEAHAVPALQSKNDLTIYELHVRDFSIGDASVAEGERGTYLAFAHPETSGMQHLAGLAAAGLKAIHLLPTFHFGSVDENKAAWQTPGDLSGFAADSSEQQARIAGVQEVDGYNWGYDPVHFFAPEGSYAQRPENRVREYRQMVMGLHAIGLRVIQDLVFNHTTAAGQDTNSVLDKIVPGYYYRLDSNGVVESSSCCHDTASEHRMMDKLMVDAVVHQARAYKIDGFRFDLMNFHFTYNMRHVRDALAELTLEQDGVDGAKIYVYGEGWNFGPTANNALGPTANQINMYGSGIGTFNDRIRDGIRGGGPFSDPRIQSFATGLFTDPNAYSNERLSEAEQRAQVVAKADWVRCGLAGNLRDFVFEDAGGARVKASQISYGGGPTGYAAVPLETVNYCSAHDNLALFDGIQLKSAAADDLDRRVRRQVLALSLIALGQGIPFFMAGDDILRSKGMDGDSFNSGDWFNKIDWTCGSTNWGIGLPIASKNEHWWPMMRPLLQNAALTPGQDQMLAAHAAFLDLLRIRQSSALFRMETFGEVQANLQFLNTGPDQMAGLIVMKLGQQVVVVFNARLDTVHFSSPALTDLALVLHPVQAQGADAVVRQSSYYRTKSEVVVPGLTTAVFVAA